ncbi:hypothetical protein HF086_003074 [Spodoptera exigua]|uniref:Uncharacterized protein n=1 Tax=Spodoptera exigua TaxID=7107 RepID=A0A922SCJ6_SPOEX|nr:hypothetical protein HF086_003074 [Spodoptera exigua]
MCFNLVQEELGAALRGVTALCAGAAKSRAVHSADAAPDDKLAMALFNSLPRRKSSQYGEESFQRNSAARRSAGHAERCVEYFVPRSLSEFNLSGAAGGAAELCELAALGARGGGGGAPGGAKPRDKMVTFEDDRAAPQGELPADDVFM